MKRLDFKQVAGRDLADHASLRLATVMSDFMDRCATLEIDSREATLMALNVMLSYSVSAAESLKLSEKGFLMLCKRHFEKERDDEA